MRRLHAFLERLTAASVSWMGSSTATVLAVTFVAGWTAGGLWVGFTDTYQLYANTFTTLVTFVMGFLILRSQMKDSLALHTKINALIVALERADNRLVALENQSEETVRRLHDSQSREALDR